MWQDPIVEEIHRYREALAKEHHFDLRKLFAALQKREKSDKRRIVTLPIHRKATSSKDSIQ
jgi:CHAD domain-containing protein